MIEVKGADGESLLFDGSTLVKFRHNGQEEAARNPASTYRQHTIKAQKGKGDSEQQYDVMIACSAIFALTVSESQRPLLDALVAELEQAAKTAP